MPLVPQNPGQPAVKPYGVAPNNNTMTLQERLMKRFAAHEFVRVKNIDDELLVWQYLPQHEEDHEYTSDPMKITRRGLPEVWQMEPGTEDIIVGANAFLMIDTLYKKVMTKRRLGDSDNDPTATLSFSFDDGNQQEAIIDKIFLGKSTPTFGEIPVPPSSAADRDETFEAKVIETERNKKVGVAGGSR